MAIGKNGEIFIAWQDERDIGNQQKKQVRNLKACPCITLV